MPSLGKREPVADRLLRFRQVDPVTGCWLWTGAMSRRTGYGLISTHSDDRKVSRGVHRASYEAFTGPIPEGMHIDHLCRTRLCFNPAHLEPVRPATNTLRGVSFSALNASKDACVRGHEFTPENTRINRRGSRVCRACRRDHALRRYHATKVLKRDRAS